MRVTIIVHGHPELTAGGAEQASYRLFEYLKREPDIAPTFVAHVPRHHIGHDCWFGLFRGRTDEIIWSPPPIDFMSLRNSNHAVLRRQMQDLLDTVKPDLLHIGHYQHFGLDLIDIAAAHAVPTILTAHEMMLICSNKGWMHTPQGKLCETASSRACQACFPSYSTEFFAGRKSMAMTALDHVRQIISPSEFVRDRLVAWGIEDRRIAVVENLMGDWPLKAPEVMQTSSDGVARKPMTFAFFGQIFAEKGVELLLDAIAAMPAAARQKARFDFFGVINDYDGFGQGFLEKISRLSDQVSYRGTYRNEDVVHLMSGADWIVVPSLWWENSPLVIEEAKMAGRPVLAADIGGMKEKASQSEANRLFEAMSAGDLARQMTRIIEEDARPRPDAPDIDGINRARLDRHLEIYRHVVGPDETFIDRASGSG